jgi:hypothetical protein
MQLSSTLVHTNAKLAMLVKTCPRLSSARCAARSLVHPLLVLCIAIYMLAVNIHSSLYGAENMHAATLGLLKMRTGTKEVKHETLVCRQSARFQKSTEQQCQWMKTVQAPQKRTMVLSPAMAVPVEARSGHGNSGVSAY